MDFVILFGRISQSLLLIIIGDIYDSFIVSQHVTFTEIMLA